MSGLLLLLSLLPPSIKSHRLSEVRVELEHVVELLLQRRWRQTFVLVVLQQVGLQEREVGGDKSHSKQETTAILNLKYTLTWLIAGVPNTSMAMTGRSRSR